VIISSKESSNENILLLGAVAGSVVPYCSECVSDRVGSSQLPVELGFVAPSLLDMILLLASNCAYVSEKPFASMGLKKVLTGT
jgi:hypothetical protein